MNATDPTFTAYASGKTGFKNSFVVNGESLRVDKAYFGSDDHGTPDYRTRVPIPDSFTLRISVWRYDESIPLHHFTTKQKIGIDSKLVGWAEFSVRNPLRTKQVEKLLPSFNTPAAFGDSVASTQSSGAN